MNPREAFLQRVRQAASHGPRPRIDAVPVRGRLGYQGAGPDPGARFCAELTMAGGQAHRAHGPEEAWAIVADLLRRHDARKIALSRGGLIERIDMQRRLHDADLEIVAADSFFAADVGITNVEYLIAETGTVVMAAKPDEPRSTSLLPPVHIALAERKQLLADLFDLFDLFSPLSPAPTSSPPSCLTLITGPSKTGDIELKLVTGVHGPGEIHVVLVEN